VVEVKATIEIVLARRQQSMFHASQPHTEVRVTVEGIEDEEKLAQAEKIVTQHAADAAATLGETLIPSIPNMMGRALLAATADEVTPVALDDDRERVKVSAIVLVDEKVGYLVTRFSESEHFASVIEAIEDAIMELAVGVEVAEDAGLDHDPRLVMNILSRSAREQPVQLIAQEFVQQANEEHKLVGDARQILAIAAEIAQNEAAMSTLDTAYGSGRRLPSGRTLGAALREVVETDLPVSPQTSR
jgi:hypothetical protein